MSGVDVLVQRLSQIPRVLQVIHYPIPNSNLRIYGCVLWTNLSDSSGRFPLTLGIPQVARPDSAVEDLTTHDAIVQAMQGTIATYFPT